MSALQQEVQQEVQRELQKGLQQELQKQELQQEIQQETQTEAEQDHQAAVHNLLSHPKVWQAGKLSPPTTNPTVSSGFAELDANLPGAGWPQAGLAEFLMQSQGMGELQLLIPLLQHLSQQQDRWITWINPPHLPYAPALADYGIDLNKILLIHPKTHEDALWSAECSTKSGTCSLVLAWFDESKLKPKDTRRLQLAAKVGGTFTCLFRPKQAITQSSMAELRVQLKPVPQAAAAKQTGAKPAGARGQYAGHSRVQVAIEKRRCGWPVDNVPLAFNHAPYALPEQQQGVQEQLTLWRTQRNIQQEQMPQTPLATTPQATTPQATTQATPGDQQPAKTSRLLSNPVH